MITSCPTSSEAEERAPVPAIALGDAGVVDPEIVEKALADNGAHDMAGATSGQDQLRAHQRVA